MTPIATPGLNKNVTAFLMLITKTEGTDKQATPYNELFGYDNFTDYSKHPNIKVNKNGYTSTAAGRYQINYPTYKMLGMKSFTPEAQDTGAIELIKRAGAYGDVVNGKFETAINKTNKIWASLPGATYGQPTYTMAAALAFIKQYAAPVVSVAVIIISALIIYLITQK